MHGFTRRNPVLARDAFGIGNGLFLKILPSGGRYWRFNYRFNGRQKALALA